MSIRGIYNADGITEYTVADQRNIHSKSFGGKVIYGDTSLVVSAQSTPNMTVKISSGECSVNGAILQNTASTNLTIASNSASYARIDAIVAYISDTTYELKVLQGTASASPTAPDCTSNTYIKLAEVTVGVGVTSIQASNVKDCRNTNNQIIIASLSKEIIELNSKVAALESTVNGAARVESLASFPYTPTTLSAVPNTIYVVSGTNKATITGMNLSQMKNGDKIYFCVATDQGSIILNKDTNFLLSASLTLTRDIVYTAMYLDGYLRMLAY